MSLKSTTKQAVQETLKSALRNKFQNYRPETSSMPFHTRLLGKDRMALFSFIHSLNTNFGTSIFEPVALALAQQKFAVTHAQYNVGNKITKEADALINHLMNQLTSQEIKPDAQRDLEALRKASASGYLITAKPTKVDIYLNDKQGNIFLFDLKSPKPNKGEFQGFKRTLLQWTAVVLAQNPNAQVHSMIAMPYNPYEPKPYERWTMAGMLDLNNELKVAEEFWSFLAGQAIYDDLLECFEVVGTELRKEIDNYFRRFAK